MRLLRREGVLELHAGVHVPTGQGSEAGLGAVALGGVQEGPAECGDVESLAAASLISGATRHELVSTWAMGILL